MHLTPQQAADAPIPVGEARYITQAEYAAAHKSVLRGVSPFARHRDKILGCHSTGLRLQAVVLNLYNSGDWAKKAPVRLDDLIANADDAHVEVLIDLLRGYQHNRENDADFLRLGRELALDRLPKPRTRREGVA